MSSFLHALHRPFILGIALTLLATLWLAYPVNAHEHPEQNQENSLENKAKALENQLICPVCPGETLNQSQTMLAKQMKTLIRERLAENESPEEILGYFVSIYGISVLAEPPKEGFSLTIWLIPPVGLLIGVIVLAFVIRNLRKPNDLQVEMPTEIESNIELRKYYRLIDKEIE